MIYDVTKGKAWSDEQSFRNTSPGTTSFYPEAGHVYYLRTRSTSNTKLNLSFYTYPSDTYLPSDGGKAVADYVVSNSSNSNTNFAIFGNEYTVNAVTNKGYTFVGWYNGETKLTDELSYTFTMSAKDVTYTAKWIKVNIERNNTSAGSVTSLNETYKVGDEATLSATTNKGYTFVGWYNGETEFSKELSYTFTMPSENVTCMAKWEVDVEMLNFTFTSTATTCSITGVKDKTVTEIIVLSYVTSISRGAFGGCGSLESITLPFVGSRASATSASSSTLFGYIFGTTIYNGGTATTQYYASGSSEEYYIPTTLKSVTITGGMILHGAFQNCIGLTSVTIGNGVTTIDNFAFYNCSGLTRINYEGTIQQWNSISKSSSWNSSTGNYTVYCTDGNIIKYK